MGRVMVRVIVPSLTWAGLCMGRKISCLKGRAFIGAFMGGSRGSLRIVGWQFGVTPGAKVPCFTSLMQDTPSAEHEHECAAICGLRL